MERGTLLQKVKEIRVKKGYVDVVELARDLGIDVVGVNRPYDSFSAHITHGQNDGYKIFVNDTHPITRQRFSIAHEIAHFVLHPETIMQNGVLAREGSSTIEQEADELAAEILMPEDAVADYLEAIGVLPDAKIDEKIIKKVAEHFRVSKAVAVIRLRELEYNVPYLPLA